MHFDCKNLAALKQSHQTGVRGRTIACRLHRAVFARRQHVTTFPEVNEPRALSRMSLIKNTLISDRVISNRASRFATEHIRESIEIVLLFLFFFFQNYRIFFYIWSLHWIDRERVAKARNSEKLKRTAENRDGSGISAILDRIRLSYGFYQVTVGCRHGDALWKIRHVVFTSLPPSKTDTNLPTSLPMLLRSLMPYSTG